MTVKPESVHAEESKTPCVDKFLEIYKPHCLTDVDHALRQIIAHKASDIEPLFEARDPLWMHKAFRQTDVTGSGHLDMAFWHLIHASSSFWDAIYTFFRALHRREIRNEVMRLNAENAELRSIVDLIDMELEQMFAHFCINGMFNAWGKPYDCTSLNNIREAIDQLKKESA